MHFDSKKTLDELINLVLADKYSTYNLTDVEQLEAIMAKKVGEILDPYEREFNEGVVDDLIFEMKKALKENNDFVYSNPLKDDYDEVEAELTLDLGTDIEGSQFICNEVEDLCRSVSGTEISNHRSDRSFMSGLVTSLKRGFRASGRRSKKVFTKVEA